jgi:D-amino-acid dehydrogenase
MTRTTEKVDVLVLGAGIVGLTLALELQRSGRQVVVVDKGEAGYGCSYGNAGWVTPCFAMPLPMPGMFLKSIGWLLNPDSPLFIKPEFSYRLAYWMWKFLGAMNEKQMNHAIQVLTEISKYSLKSYQDLAQKYPGTFGYDQKGLLMVSANKEGMKAIELEMKLVAGHGIPGVLLDQKQAIELEPSLKPIIQGGVHFTTEASVEPLDTVKAILKEFLEAGGKLQPRTEVYDFTLQGDRIQEVITTRGIFEAELVVCALGSWSPKFSKKLGINVPILGGKGYSLIVDEFKIKPRVPMMIVDRKIAVTPRASSVRLAGTLELVDGDESITARRVNNILEGSKTYLHIAEAPKVHEVWRGLRPCTPDGVPMLGYSKKWKNLFYSIGHQMLGLQSAPGSARLSGDLILRRDPITDPYPFRPERFE